MTIHIKSASKRRETKGKNGKKKGMKGSRREKEGREFMLYCS